MFLSIYFIALYNREGQVEPEYWLCGHQLTIQQTTEPHQAQEFLGFESVIWRQALRTFQAKAVELAGNVRDEASGASADAKLGNEVADDGVEGLVVSLHSLGSQHVLPQEAPHRLPLLAFPGDMEQRANETTRKLEVDVERQQIDTVVS